MTNDLSQQVNRDYQVRVGNYFSRGWHLFRQFTGGFIAYTILVILIAIILSRLPQALGNGINFFVSPILIAGFFIVALRLTKSKSTDFNHFFRGFNQYVPLLLVSVVGNILVLIGMLLLILPGIYLSVAYAFAMLILLETKVDFWTALETSRKIVTKKWFSIFGLMLCLFLLNFVGAIVLGIGLVVTIPWSACILVAAFEDIIGLRGIGRETAI